MKLIVVLALAGAVLAVGGVGFAWGGGGGCDDHHHGGCTPEPGIAWVAPTSVAASAHSVVCAVTPTSSVLTTSASGLYPGTHCWLNATLENTGNALAGLVPHISATLPRGCTSFTYADNLLSASPEVELAPGHTFAYHAVFGLAAGAGNSCEHVGASFSVTISASGNPSCDGFPENPDLPNQDGSCCG
ncbi:MAG: hypothetical protein ACLQD8_01620 [Thermoplasmata archaeon]